MLQLVPPSFLQQGFIVQGVVRELATPEEGIRFVSGMEQSLPASWDLLDGFKRVDFGPWRPDGRKNINATLRSMGLFDERWNGSKFDALWHPIPSRATVILDYDRMLDEGALCAAGLLREFPGAPLILSRIEVEVFVLERYLRREDWTRRLWPDLGESERSGRASEIVGRGRHVLEAARRVSSKLSSAGGEAVLASYG